jgi:predicted flavoprotein YhiN
MAFLFLLLTRQLADVDGITGGYNFQHAWTSGYLAGVAAAGRVHGY